MPAAGGSTTVVTVADALLPATSECTIIEETLDEIPLTDGSYAWNTPTYAPADGVVALEPGAVGTVTVTNSTQRVFTQLRCHQDPGRGRERARRRPRPEACCSPARTRACTAPMPAGDRHLGPDRGGRTMVESGDDPRRLDVRGHERGSAGCAGGRRSVVRVAARSTWGRPSRRCRPRRRLRPSTSRTTAIRILGAGFSVTKIVAGDLTGLVDDSEFDFEWSCIADNGDEYPADGPGIFTLIAGELWSVPESVPVGSECTVTETAMPDPTHPSYTWSTAMAVTGAAGTPDGSEIVFEIPPADAAEPGARHRHEHARARPSESYSVAKSSDPATGSTVEPGDEITYTVTVTPGPVGFVDDVVVVDDLSAVTPYATLDPASIVAVAGHGDAAGRQPRVERRNGGRRGGATHARVQRDGQRRSVGREHPQRRHRVRRGSAGRRVRPLHDLAPDAEVGADEVERPRVGFHGAAWRSDHLHADGHERRARRRWWTHP